MYAPVNLLITLLYAAFFITRYATSRMFLAGGYRSVGDPFNALFRLALWILFFVTGIRVIVILIIV